MSEQSLVWLECVEVIQQPETPRFDFGSVKVAPPSSSKHNDVSVLEIDQRKEMIVKLIEKVKSL